MVRAQTTETPRHGDRAQRRNSVRKAVQLHKVIQKGMILHILRTTLIIPEDLMRQLKKNAVDSNRTLSEVVADSLRKGLQAKRGMGKVKKLPTFSMGEAKVDVADREQLYRAMEEN